MAKTKAARAEKIATLDHDVIYIGDDEYDLPKRWTVREFRLVKLQYAILGGNVDFAVAAGDQDGFAAYALVALRRARPDTPIEEHINFLDDLPSADLDIRYAGDPARSKPLPPG